VRSGDELSFLYFHVGRDGNRGGWRAQAEVQIYLDTEQSRATVGEDCRASRRMSGRGVIVSGRHEHSTGCPRRREQVGRGG
jgi:hypothetical protein